MLLVFTDLMTWLVSQARDTARAIHAIVSPGRVVATLARNRSGALAILGAVLISQASAQVRTLSPRDRSGTSSGVRPGSITQAPASWTFQLKPNVDVAGSMVRVGDVIEPVDIPRESWATLRDSMIGLVPIDGRPLRLMRYRLADALSQSRLVNASILWTGPDACIVRSTQIQQVAAKSRPLETGAKPKAFPSVTASPVSSPAGVKATEPRKPLPFSPPVQQVTQRSPAATAIKIPVALTGGQRTLVNRAIGHVMSGTNKRFQYEIDWDRLAEENFKDVTQFRQIAIPDDMQVGEARFVLTAQVGTDIREIPVYLRLSALPQGVVAARPLQRGQIVRPGDVALKPIDRGAPQEGLESDPELVVGMQLRRAVPAGRWISKSDYGPPILVERNDLVELVVVGGGVVVRTGAKAMAAGAKGELIQVETVEGRRRLLGRVASTGLVEIVTRAPQVKR